MCVHIGMAGPRPFYQIERRGHRRGYNSKDVDGERLDDDEDDEEWTWRGCPDEIESDLSIKDVMLRWKGFSPVREPLLHHLSLGCANPRDRRTWT